MIEKEWSIEVDRRGLANLVDYALCKLFEWDDVRCCPRCCGPCHTLDTMADDDSLTELLRYYPDLGPSAWHDRNGRLDMARVREQWHDTCPEILMPLGRDARIVVPLRGQVTNSGPGLGDRP